MPLYKDQLDFVRQWATKHGIDPNNISAFTDRRGPTPKPGYTYRPIAPKDDNGKPLDLGGLVLYEKVAVPKTQEELDHEHRTC